MSKKKAKKNKPEKEIVLQQTTLPVNQPEVTPMAMLQMAYSQGAPVEQMERLWALNEKVEAANAKKAYVSAMANFKRDAPEIEKDQQVRFQNQDNTWTEYWHASLGNVVDKIVERLAEYGFSHNWDVKQPQGGQIEVTCVITHEMGHSESVMLSSSRDESGKKNNIQQLSSAITYLQRYTLLSATGLATQDMDDDGRTAEFEDEIILISEKEVNELDALLVENEISRETFNEWLFKDMGVKALHEVAIDQLARVRAAINASIKSKKQEKK